MPAGKIRIVPWLTIQEWLEVYNNAYSGDLQSQIKAVEKIEEWRDRNMHCPPAALLTGSILSTVVKDSVFHPNVQEALGKKDLEVIYSTHIMRFLNMALEEKYQKSADSLYSRGKKTGIPDWIVNLRHKVAHSYRLPALDYSQNAVCWVLNYLKENYWEIEKKSMKEYRPERPKGQILEQKIRGLLDIYILLFEQNANGIKKVKMIPTSKMRTRILSFTKHIPQTFEAETLMCEEEAALNVDIKNFKRSDLVSAMGIILGYLKSYLKWPYSYFQPVKIIIKHMIDDAESHNGCRFDLWSHVIKMLYVNDYFPEFILNLTYDVFINEKFTYRGDYSAKMLIYLLEALVKRGKLEKLKKDLSKETPRPSSKKRVPLKLSLFEQKILKKLHLRRNLNLNTEAIKARIAICATLTARIEKKYPTLRKALRLIEYKPLRDSDLIKILKVICDNPNDFANRCIELLFELFQKDIQSEKDDILKLLKVFHGEGLSIKKINKIYTLKKLSKESSEEEMLAIDESEETLKTEKLLNEDEDQDLETSVDTNEPCTVHQERSNCPWRTVNEFDWVSCPIDSLPWREKSPFEILPYTGGTDNEISFIRFKGDTKTDFFTTVNWNMPEKRKIIIEPIEISSIEVTDNDNVVEENETELTKES
ncbi:uncharacterized protein LOC106668625 [Cimex lectularius]|uniref:Uncharacterized protein n=1 Tax=Cimex lectularius TaxID=79782 RepID=A0A8I6RX42_CIMLE|nr:uncharacterized protein LOC106668625 [Cimex lectularius]